jgi:hypothetical protein
MEAQPLEHDGSMSFAGDNAPEPYRPSKRAALIVASALAGVFAFSAVFSPPEGDYPTICGLKAFAGIPCPACGLTHSFCSIGKGEIIAGFEYNLLGPFLFINSVILLVRSVCVLAGWSRAAWRLDGIVTERRTIRFIVWAFLVFGGARVAYLLISGTGGWKDAPLAKWITTFFA